MSRATPDPVAERRSLLLVGPRRLEWVTEETPRLGSKGVLIKTLAGAVSVGTELPLYRGVARTAYPLRYPLMTAYENIGTVVGVGRGVRRFSGGERVVASYGHRTYGVLPEGRPIPVPDDIPDELALLAILTCDVAKGVRKLAPKPEEEALVTGGGAIGLLTLFVLQAYGVRNVDLIEPRAERRALARELGARRVVAPEEAETLGHYPFGLECSASAAAFALLQERMQAEGRICILSDGNVEPLTLTPAFHAKQLSVVGSSDGWDYQEHARWFFDVAHGGPHLERVFGLETGFDELPQTFERMATGEVSPVKVLVRY